LTRQVIQRDTLGVLTKIGQGGQGVVYGAPNVKTKFAPSMVYKEYKTQTLSEVDFAALAAMPALVEDSLSYAEAERLISVAAWPCALVEDAAASTGFVMPAIPQEFFMPLTTVKGVSTVTADFQHLFNHPTVLAARGIDISATQRYTLLRELASGLAFLHKHGVCVGDISPKNLLFSLSPHEAVYFIDCDAMRINGVSVQRQVETPGWEAPAGEELATIYSDTYKLGLTALRLLVGDHDTTNPRHLPPTAPDLVRQIITDTLANQPRSRPLPEAWTYVMGHAIEYAQHRQKTAAAAPVDVAPAAPPTPIVHSRPTSRPSAPPPSPAVPSRVPAPAGAAAPRQGASSSKLWAGIALAATVLITAVVMIIVTLASSDDSAQSTAPQGLSSTETWSPAFSPDSSTVPTTSSWTPPIGSAPPPLVQTPDAHDVSCADGYQMGGHSGWATHSGRGTDETSCQFALSVLQAYWLTYHSPSPKSRHVFAAGLIPCPQVSRTATMVVQCSGDDFVMTCAVNGGDSWITCTGGNDAKVYLY
jgi:serine/threonine protein kinase